MRGMMFFLGGALAGAIVKNKGVAIGGEHEGDIQRFGVVEGLLHTIADAVAIVLRLDQRDRDIRFVIEDDVSLLRLAARDQLAANDDSALGEKDLLPNLRHRIPAGLFYGGQDEFATNVSFGETTLVHRGSGIGRRRREVMAQMASA